MSDINGRHLQKRRKELKLTLEQVGNIVGVGKSTVRKWETGDIENMRRDKIALLAKALKTTPLYIMGIDESNEEVASNDFDISIDEILFLNKYRSLDEKGKYTVNAVLEVEYDRCAKPYLMPIAAHNDDYSEEQIELMRKDLDKLDKL
ncbi:helix-turn-helix domain-containing protein [Cohnella sp.]|uniref:helix-turn-helix domain-containing protein n=1 Tax=Cohnella sp. TaxID=1883426 RepID=UPI003569CF05